MFNDLIDYEDLQEASPETFGFSDVTFKRDFGPWKKFEEVDDLWFDLETSEVKSFAKDGKTVTNSCKFQLTAVV